MRITDICAVTKNLIKDLGSLIFLMLLSSYNAVNQTIKLLITPFCISLIFFDNP